MQVITVVNALYSVYNNEFAQGAFGRDFDRALDQWQFIADEIREVLHPFALLSQELLLDVARLSGRVCGWVYSHRAEIRAVFVYLLVLIALQISAQLGNREAADELASEVRSLGREVKEGAIALARKTWSWVAPKIADTGLSFTRWAVGKALDVREKLAISIRRGVELEKAAAV